MMNAIPTTYAGVNFRSRLEAQWAAWFDLAGWQWQYEPVDFYKWAPDFAITGNEMPIMVEVKPVAWTESPYGRKHLELEQYAKAVAHDGGDFHILLLGLGPMEDHDSAYIGMCNEPDFGGGGMCGFERAQCQGATPESGAEFGYGSEIQGFYDRVSGYYPGGSHDGSGHTLAVPMWRSAGNKVRWAGK